MSGARDVAVLWIVGTLLVATIVGEAVIADVRKARDDAPTTIVMEDLQDASDFAASAGGMEPVPASPSTPPPDAPSPGNETSSAPANATPQPSPSTVAPTSPTPRPPTDQDRDRIPDSRDRCPTRPETFNGFNDQDGCPDTVARTRAS